MDPIDKFDTVAEIAVTLAGFSGLVMALKFGGKLGQEELRRIVYLIVASFSVLATALLPAVLVGLGFSQLRGLDISCFVLGLVAIVLGTNGVVSWRKAQVSPRFPKATIFSLAAALANGVLLMISAVSTIFASPAGVLLLGQVVLLLIAGWIFLSTIIWASVGDKDSEP